MDARLREALEAAGRNISAGHSRFVPVEAAVEQLGETTTVVVVEGHHVVRMTVGQLRHRTSKRWIALVAATAVLPDPGAHRSRPEGLEGSWELVDVDVSSDGPQAG